MDELGAIRAALVDVDISTAAGAFVLGLAMGQAMERERQRAEDEDIHRAAVATLRRHVGWHEARTAAGY